MTLDRTLELLNKAVAESVITMGNEAAPVCTTGDDVLKDLGIDSLDWSIVLMHIEDEVLLSEEVIGELGEIIGKGGTVQDMTFFFELHGL